MLRSLFSRLLNSENKPANASFPRHTVYKTFRSILVVPSRRGIHFQIMIQYDIVFILLFFYSDFQPIQGLRSTRGRTLQNKRHSLRG